MSLLQCFKRKQVMQPSSQDLIEAFKHRKNTLIKSFLGFVSLLVLPMIQELAEPSIKDAFDVCVCKGVTRVIVSPFFRFPGRHWHKDIPSLTAEATSHHPGVSYIVSAPLGLHELLVDVVNDRITHCLCHVPGDVNECEVCAGTSRCRVCRSDE